MADAGIFIGWTRSVRGRERQSLTVFNEAIEYYAGLKQRGEIEGFDTVLLEPHGGDLGGFILVKGDAEQMARVRASDDFLRLNVRAGLIVDGLGVVGAAIGPGVEAQVGLYLGQLDELT
jgi:hypothetical protein